MYVVDLVPLKHRCKQAHIHDYTKKPHMHWTLSSVVQAWKFILNGLFIRNYTGVATATLKMFTVLHNTQSTPYIRQAECKGLTQSQLRLCSCLPAPWWSISWSVYSGLFPTVITKVSLCAYPLVDRWVLWWGIFLGKRTVSPPDYLKFKKQNLISYKHIHAEAQHVVCELKQVSAVFPGLQIQVSCGTGLSYERNWAPVHVVSVCSANIT
jgi:hypothetical protein